jgi:hypothetical protein
VSSPLDLIGRGHKKPPFGNDQHVYRPVLPARRLRAKLILAAFMGISTLATGLFIHVKLSRQTTEVVAAAEPAAAETAAPTAERAISTEAEPFGKTRSISLSPAGAAQPADSDEDVDALGHQDPRWVRDATAVTATVAAKVNPALAKAVTAVAPPVEASAFAAPETDGASAAAADREFTAAIAPNAPKLDAQETDEDPTSGQTTRILRAVNLRISPKSGSRVIKVLPAGATVDLVGCNIWCEVSYQGSRGFIYKSFVGGGSSASAKPRKAVAKVAAQEPEPAQRKPMTVRQ